MKRVSLNAERREVTTKGDTNRIRREGKIPAVVYGKITETFYVAVNYKDFTKIEHEVGRSAIFDLNVEGKTYPSIIKEIQIDPIKRNIIHIDFEAVDLSKPVYMTIPLTFVGEAIGVKKGGILDPSLHEIEVEGLLTDLPDKVEVDVSNLDIKDVIYVKDLNLGDKVKIYSDPDAVVVSVVTPTTEEVVAPASTEAQSVAQPTEAKAETKTESSKEGAKEK
ncbi:MAG: 50S ribosomal protein L25/general stress protein Ctc [Caldisericum exile]|uniref:50S ribosomal protein L25/general stress protein Ctc n=1 Tax=Caldisericum exile TaxID=693075 RepID=UPI003C728B5E